MPGRHTEAAFEAAIEAYLTTSGGYVTGDRNRFDAARCIDPDTLLAFIEETQPDEWAYLQNLQKDKAAQTLIDDLCRALDSEHEGALSVLRHGFKCFGKLFRAAFFAPASGMNPETERRHAANRLSITRQVRYSTRHGNTLDVVLVLNGIPVVTAELKNPMTRQTWRDAVHQYKHDRDSADLLFQFKKRALVHFAADPDEVYMTTRIAGRNTHFLPFNKGRAGGAGNPDNPGGWRTAYLWEEVLERRSLLDILARFVHLQVEEKRLGSKKIKRETMIFPPPARSAPASRSSPMAGSRRAPRGNCPRACSSRKSWAARWSPGSPTAPGAFSAPRSRDRARAASCSSSTSPFRIRRPAAATQSSATRARRRPTESAAGGTRSFGSCRRIPTSSPSC